MTQPEQPTGREPAAGPGRSPSEPPAQDHPHQDQQGRQDQQAYPGGPSEQPDTGHWPGPGQPGPSPHWPGSSHHGYQAYGSAPYPPPMQPGGMHPAGSSQGADPQAALPQGYQPVRPLAKPRKLPAEPVPYQHLVRGPAFRWWKPLLVFLLGIAFALVSQLVLAIVWIILVVATGGNVLSFLDGMALTGPMDALTFGYVTASLIALIPSSMFASWIVHGIRPGFLSSVAGRIRWRWLARCLVVTVPVFVVYMGIQFLIGWDYAPKPPQWVALLIIVLIAIPFQSAGEEYAFRGLIMQNVGGWFRNPVVALIVSIIPSVAFFGLAHGSLDVWILCDLAIFATAACLLTWRTGGMEAAIVLHATNNVLIMICTILFGGWEAAFISTDSEGSALAVLLSLVVEAIVVALILWQAKRAGIQRLYRPSGDALPAAA